MSSALNFTKPEPRAADVWNCVTRSIRFPRKSFAAAWSRPGDTPIWLSRSSWGMAAVADAVAEKLGREVNFWLPEYFCDQALWPLRQRRVALHFYPVDPHARPDWRQIEATKTPADLFLLVHYFGHSNDSTAARAFCDDRKCLLIEDAAQALGPYQNIGEAGDVVLYSPYKFFQVPNGALMMIRPRAAAWVEPISAAVARLGNASALGLKWMKGFVRPAREETNFHTPEAFFFDPPTLPMGPKPKASPVSKPILSSVSLEEAAARRRQNDEAIRAYFRGQPGWEPLFREPSGAPMRTAFRVDSPERAASAFAALRTAGVRAEGWPTLPPEVRDPNSWAVKLRRTAMYLPCHQDLSLEAIHLALDQSGLRRDAGARLSSAS